MLIEVLKRALRALRGSDSHAAAHDTREDPYASLERAQSAHREGALEEALNAYDAALDLLPDSLVQQRAAVLVNMGAALRERVQLPEAISRLREATRLQPALAAAHYNLGLTLYETGESVQAEHALRTAVGLDPEFQAAHSTLLCLHGLSRSRNPERVLAEHRSWAARFADPLTVIAPPHLNDRKTGRKLTVGYVSADFREHSIARFISPVLAHHDRSGFRVICYDNWPAGDSTTEHLRRLADDWRKIDALDDEHAAALVREDRVDILVDLSGHTAGNRLLMFARKPAPVQASWLGYMCTTGMAAMDWHITDAYLDPPGASEAGYTEKLARIVSAAAFEPHPDSPTVNTLPAFANGFVRFGSFNNYTKIGDEVVALWGRVLAALPDARLLLVALGGDTPEFKSSVRARFDRLAPRSGVSERIDVIGRRPLQDFLRLFHDVDIALDPFPYGGGTTSLHTLWMGVPIVTLEGDSELARSTSGMMIACGLDSLVAHTEKEYLDIAVQHATDLPCLDDLRKHLRPRLAQSFLGNAAAVTLSLEGAYRMMWTEYLRSTAQRTASATEETE